MTCSSPSKGFVLARRAAAPRHRLMPMLAAVAFASLLLAGAFTSEARAEPKPLRSEDGSLLGVVDSVHASVVTVVCYPPSDASPRPGMKRKRFIGTAIALSERRILTTASIAVPGGSVRVLLKGGVERPAVLLGVDRTSNIALFQVEGATLRGLDPAPPQSLAIGAWVAVISNVSVTHPQAALGQIIGRGERMDYARSGDILEIDAPSYPGSTGGAVLNEDGDWVAVIVGRAVPGPGDGSRVGLNPGDDEPAVEPSSVLIALPVDQVTWLAKELETYGSVRRGYLGIQLRRSVSAAPESIGVLVASVVPASPADSAGIRAGDRVLAIKGEEAHTADELTAKVRAERPGDVIELTVLRGTEIFPLRVTVGAAFAQPPVGPRPSLAPDVNRMKQEVQRLEQEKQRLEEQIRELENPPQR
jgi:S1-C subfamily serine protease